MLGNRCVKEPTIYGLDIDTPDVNKLHRKKYQLSYQKTAYILQSAGTFNPCIVGGILVVVQFLLLPFKVKSLNGIQSNA
jgi:hypothetical protein